MVPDPLLRSWRGFWGSIPRRRTKIRKAVADYGVDVSPRLKTLKVVEPPKRSAGIKVDNAADLVAKLKNEAGVL